MLGAFGVRLFPHAMAGFISNGITITSAHIKRKVLTSFNQRLDTPPAPRLTQGRIGHGVSTTTKYGSDQR